jgi:integrase
LIHITPELINKERKLLADTSTPQGTKKSASTINRYMAVLSSTLSYALKRLRWLSENPCAHLLRLKENPGRDRILSETELFTLLDACRASKSTYLYPIVLISLTTGARQGEILGLEWRHIDFENNLAHLTETKNGKPRSIALAEPILVELKKLYEKRDLKKPLVFASKTPFGRVDIKKAWHTALKRANISDCRRHDMRHTFSTMSAAHGASNLELATAMAIEPFKCFQRYTHLDVQVTKKFSYRIFEKIFPGDHP